MSWPWLTKMRKHSVADTESALISDLFDIFVRIVHNARFRLLSKQDVNFRIFILHFTNVVCSTATRTV